ncbi:MAG: glycosyl transferase family protein, partial [uncultured bacterium]
KGKYIVIVDSDDKCLPNRFEQQVKYFQNNSSKVDVLGTAYNLYSDDQMKKIIDVVRANAKDLYDGKPPVHNPTCMIKKNIFLKYGYYDSRFDNAEDVELWFRWYSQGVKFKNIPEVLYKKRIHSGSVSIAKIKSQEYLLLKINLIALLKYKIKFSRKGYLRVLEQALYLLYLTFGLDKIYKKNK